MARLNNDYQDLRPQSFRPDEISSLEDILRRHRPIEPFVLPTPDIISTQINNEFLEEFKNNPYLQELSFSMINYVYPRLLQLLKDYCIDSTNNLGDIPYLGSYNYSISNSIVILNKINYLELNLNSHTTIDNIQIHLDEKNVQYLTIQKF